MSFMQRKDRERIKDFLENEIVGIFGTILLFNLIGRFYFVGVEIEYYSSS